MNDMLRPGFTFRHGQELGGAPRRFGALRGTLVVAGALYGVGMAAASPASAQIVVEVDAPTLTLGEVVAGAPEALRQIDLGPTPPAGSSRLLVRAELRRMLAAAGVEAHDISLPQAVRVKTRSERWSVSRLTQAATQTSQAALPAGVQLQSASVRLNLVLPEGTVATRLELPTIPKRAGQAKLSAVLLLEHDSQVIRRVPVALVVDISEEAARPLLAKGAVLRVYIEKSSAKIAALAEALQEGDVGDTLQFRIQATRRVVRAKVESQHRARVVSR